MSYEYTYGVCKDENVELKKVKLVKNTWGYFLDMTYQVETPAKIEEIHLPMVRLPINTKRFILKTDDGFLRPTAVADVGFGIANLYQNKDRVYYTIETKEIKTKEMTLEEIEEKLGHKVKIVNK